MAELKLKQLHRGYVLTDFNDNEVGIKDTEQAMEEIKKLLSIDKKIEQSIADEHIQETKPNPVELHRNIFEKAKEQISIHGKINCSQIARELGINISKARNHINKMNIELEGLIKKWQDERDKQVPNDGTKTNIVSDEIGKKIPNDETGANNDRDKLTG